MPASSPACASFSSTFIPRRSAQRISMRSSISAQSCESVPPAPAFTVTTASPESYSPEKSRASSSSASRDSIDDRWPSSSAAIDSSSSASSSSVSRSSMSDSSERNVSSRRADRGVLRRHGRRALLVVPEARRLHLALELGQPSVLAASGSKRVREQLQLAAEATDVARRHGTS